MLKRLIRTVREFCHRRPAVSEESLDRLRLRLAEAEAVGEVSTEELATLSALLDAASRVLDPRDSPEARASAVSDAMVSSRDERMLRLVWVASQVRSVAVRRSVVAQVATWDHPEVVELLKARAQSKWETREIRVKAIHALRDRGDDDAAMFLYALAADTSVDSDVRAAAVAALDERFPEFMAGRHRGRPAVGGSFAGVGSLVAGNALAGGVMLNSVGIWGKANAAPEIGALSGAVIGGATAGLYARSNPISTGAGLGYTSNVAWGLVGASFAEHIVYGDDDSASAQNMGALIRTLGVGAGAFTGYRRIDRNPDVGRVWRVNTVGKPGSSGPRLAGRRRTSRRGSPRRTRAATLRLIQMPAGPETMLGRHASRGDGLPASLPVRV